MAGAEVADPAKETITVLWLANTAEMWEVVQQASAIQPACQPVLSPSIWPCAAIEIFPPAWPWDIHRQWLEQDPLTQLQWWGLVVKVGCIGCYPILFPCLPLLTLVVGPLH